MYQGNSAKSEPITFRTASDTVTSISETEADRSEYVTAAYTVTGISLPVEQSSVQETVRGLREHYNAGYYVLHTSNGRSVKVRI